MILEKKSFSSFPLFLFSSLPPSDFTFLTPSLSPSFLPFLPPFLASCRPSVRHSFLSSSFGYSSLFTYNSLLHQAWRSSQGCCSWITSASETSMALSGNKIVVHLLSVQNDLKSYTKLCIPWYQVLSVRRSTLTSIYAALAVHKR